MPSPMPDSVYGFSFHALGGKGHIRIATATPSQAEAAVIDAVAWLRSAEARYSRFLPQSLVSKLNRGERVRIDPEFRELLSASKRSFSTTFGRIDASALPIWKLWHDPLRKSPPTCDELNQALRLKSLREIDPDENHLLLPRQEMGLDFGAIAKEWCVDQIVLRLQHRGLSNVLIELAGDIAARGKQSERHDGWWVLLSESRKAVLLQDAALATSGHGTRFRTLGSQRISHLIDAQTGLPTATQLRSATVLAASCMEAGTAATDAALAPDLQTAHERVLPFPALFRTARNHFLATPSLLHLCREVADETARKQHPVPFRNLHRLPAYA